MGCFAEVCDIYLAPNFNGRNKDVLLLTGASFRMSLLDRNLPYLTCAQFGLEKIGKGIFFLFPVGIIWKMVTPFHSLIMLVIR